MVSGVERDGGGSGPPRAAIRRCDKNWKMRVKTAKTGAIRGTSSILRLLRAAKLQSGPGTDNLGYAATQSVSLLAR